MYASSSNLIVLGVTDLGTGLLAIFTVVIALIVGVFLFRKGIHWMKHAGGGGVGNHYDWRRRDDPTGGYSKEELDDMRNGTTNSAYFKGKFKNSKDFINHRNDS